MRTSRPVLKISKFDGQVVREFPSVNQAAIEARRGHAVIYQATERNGLIEGNFFYRYKDEWAGREDFRKGQSRPVLAWTEGTDEVLWFLDSREAEKSLYLRSGSVCYAISRHKGVLKRLGYKFSYQKSSDEVVELMRIGVPVKKWSERESSR